MVPQKEHIKDVADSPRTSSSTDEEEARLMMGNSPGDGPARRQKSRSSCTIYALALSNVLTVVILLLVVGFQLRRGSARCEESEEVFIPKKEAWFPPESE